MTEQENLTEKLKAGTNSQLIHRALIEAYEARNAAATEAFDEKAKLWPWQFCITTLYDREFIGTPFLCESEEGFKQMRADILRQIERGPIELKGVRMRGHSLPVDLVISTERIVHVTFGPEHEYIEELDGQ